MILHGNCLDRMKEMPDNSVDSIVTDPPYGLSFMGKKWDYDVPSTEIWIEALRVLKPGGHLLAFFGTRTYHRGVVRIEDAGLEIRDQIMWIYGSGFPKSHNIKEGEFKGFGTALKPANEPIVVARKPLEKGLTIANNVQKWGCGALNVDGARIGSEIIKTNAKIKGSSFTSVGNSQGYNGCESSVHQGRWPSNLIFDEAAAEMLDEQSGDRKTGTVTPQNISRTQKSTYGKPTQNCNQESYGGGSGGASRFFYVAKASKSERNRGLEGLEGLECLKFNGKSPANINQNHHPTVKPIKLMEYLIRLVTPPKGIVLDPFMGSGSTGVAAKNLGFDFIGIELNEEYIKIAKKRIETA